MIAAVVLAAGLSTRMGRPKLILPWGSTTVIGQVIATLVRAGLDDVVVVTGASRAEVEAAVREGHWEAVWTVFNPRYPLDDMLISLQVGMAALGNKVEAALVALGDQPFIEVEIVRALLEAYRAGGKPLIVPSYHLHRGHPWIVDRSLWLDLLSATLGTTMRDFLHAHAQQTTYIPVESPSILRDVDTPEDYARSTILYDV